MLAFGRTANGWRTYRSQTSGSALNKTWLGGYRRAVRQAARGGDSIVAPAVTRRLIERFATRRGPTHAPASAIGDLTAREVEVLRLIAGGLSNSEIAQSLKIGEATVKTHVARVLMKLELRDRVQAVIFAYESGLLTGSGPTHDKL